MTFGEISSYYKELAKEDNSSELLKMGKKCLKENKFHQAFDYFNSASLFGNSDAQRYLGLLYLQNEAKTPLSEGEKKRFEQNVGEALRFLEQSADNNNPKTLFLLGILYIEGFREPRRITRRRVFYEDEKENDPNEPKPNKEQGILYMERAIALKYKRAMKYLYDYYSRERHIENYLEKADNLAKDALKMGYKDLIEGSLDQIMDNDIEQKIRVIKYLADSGDSYYQRKYGRRQYRTFNDFEKAYTYLKKSADQGDVKSMFNYGYYNIIGYNEGHGSREEGFKYLKKSAENGCLAASYFLGLYNLHNDYDVGFNMYKAIKYFHRAATFHDPDAQIALGKVFLYNDRKFLFPDLAIKYFGMAAHGHILSQDRIIIADWPIDADEENDVEENENDENENGEENEEEEEGEDDEFNIFALRLFYPHIPESSVSYEKPNIDPINYMKKYKRFPPKKVNFDKLKDFDGDNEDFDDPLVKKVYQIIGNDIEQKKKLKTKKVIVFVGTYASEYTRKDERDYMYHNYRCQGLFGMAQSFKEIGAFDNSFKYYHEAIKMKYTEAMNELGNIYKDGSFGEPNYEQAIKYFDLAWEYKNPDALYYKGRMYYDGIGVEKNVAKGKKLFQLAIKYGSTVAQRNMQHGNIMQLLHY